jgi:signal transduction histidine kinase
LQPERECGQFHDNLLRRATYIGGSPTDPMSHLSSSNKQLLLFLGAVLAPSALLVAFALRAVRHEESLAREVASAARAQAAKHVGQQLQLSLDRMRVLAVADPRGTAGDPAVVAVWTRRCGRGGANCARQVAPRDASLLRDVERIEFRAPPDSAIAAYRAAIAATRDSAISARLQLGLARTLARAGREDAAVSMFSSLLAFPWDITDDEGIPVALYAAERLRGSARHREMVSARIATRLAPGNLGSLEAYMLRDIAQSLDSDSLRSLAAARTRQSERLAALDRDLSALLRLSGVSVPIAGEWQSAWMPVPEPLWLVGAQGAPDGDTVVIVVDAPAVASQLETSLAGVVGGPITLTINEEGPGESLAPGFPALRANFATPDLRVSRTRALGVPLLLFVLLLAALAAYLLWRDIRREARATALRSRFVSAVSHELKTPLTSIRMFAEMMRMHPDDVHRRATFLDTIIGESERLTRLIDNVLHFSRMEERRQQFHFAPGEIQEVVREAVEAMEYPMSQVGLTLNLSIEDGIPPLPVDRDAMTQAVLNLLSNAIKFSPQGGSIELRLARADGEVLIMVRDEGLGIAPDEQGRIFEEFYRSPEAEARGIEGTGLGLALVSEVVRAHGGGVAVSSAPGSGSAFTIRLPLGRQE